MSKPHDGAGGGLTARRSPRGPAGGASHPTRLCVEETPEMLTEGINPAD